MQTRLPTEERQAEIVAAALRLARDVSPALITTSDIAVGRGRDPGRGVQALPDQGRDLAGGDELGARAVAGERWTQAAAAARRRRCEASARCSTPMSTSSSPIPGVPRFIFHELQQPADSPVKQEVRALLQAYRKLLLRLLGAAVEQGEVPADLDREAAATLFVGIVQGLVMQSMLTGKPAAMKAQADRVFAIYLRGIGEAP